MDKARIKEFLNKDISNEKIDPRIVALFLKQLSLLLKSGLPIDKALHIIEGQNIDKKLTRTLKKVSKNLADGLGSYESFKKEEKAFSPLILAFIKSGDQAGNLGDVLENLSDFLNEDNKNKNTIRAAFVYPIILLIVSLFVVIMIFTYVFPKFIVTLEDSQVSLPQITRVMMAITNFFTSYGLKILRLILFIRVFNRLLSLNGAYKFWLDERKFKRKFFYSFRLLKFEYDLSSLLYILKKGDVEIVESLGIIKDGFKNTYLKSLIATSLRQVGLGKSLSSSFKDLNVFSGLFISMLEIGETGSNMTESLYRASSYYSNEYIFRLNKISRMVEPILIIFMGFVVALVVFSIAIPLYNSIELYA